MRAWLRDVANRRTHATTGRAPAEALDEERGALLPLAVPWGGRVPRPAEPAAAAPTPRAPTPRPPAPVIQRPLSVYEGLLVPRVAP